MSYTKQHAKMAAAILAGLAALVPSGWRIASASAANPERPALGTKTVNITAQTRMDPVIVTKVTVGGEEVQPGVSTAGVREVRPGTPFQADEDWLSKTSISLKNRTDKMIVRAEIQLFFPDTGDGSPSRAVTAHMITIGQRPDIDSFSSRGQKLPPEPDQRPLLLAPGQTLVVHLADYLDEIRSRVEEKLLFTQVTRLVIQRFQFYFVDGMRWSDLEGFGVPDPNHPGQFTNMDRGRYFPGHPSQNWPPGE